MDIISIGSYPGKYAESPGRTWIV